MTPSSGSRAAQQVLYLLYTCCLMMPGINGRAMRRKSPPACLPAPLREPAIRRFFWCMPAFGRCWISVPPQAVEQLQARQVASNGRFFTRAGVAVPVRNRHVHGPAFGFPVGAPLRLESCSTSCRPYSTRPATPFSDWGDRECTLPDRRPATFQRLAVRFGFAFIPCCQSDANRHYPLLPDCQSAVSTAPMSNT